MPNELLPASMNWSSSLALWLGEYEHSPNQKPSSTTFEQLQDLIHEHLRDMKGEEMMWRKKALQAALQGVRGVGARDGLIKLELARRCGRDGVSRL